MHNKEDEEMKNLILKSKRNSLRKASAVKINLFNLHFRWFLSEGKTLESAESDRPLRW